MLHILLVGKLILPKDHAHDVLKASKTEYISLIITDDVGTNLKGENSLITSYIYIYV